MNILSKKYFSEINKEICYDIESQRDIMKSHGLSQLKLTEAQKVVGADYFYCTFIGEIGEKGDCGKQCDHYSPRNGKNGICKHNGGIYEQTDKEITIKL
jgi:hypothetical protein